MTFLMSWLSRRCFLRKANNGTFMSTTLMFIFEGFNIYNWLTQDKSLTLQLLQPKLKNTAKKTKKTWNNNLGKANTKKKRQTNLLIWFRSRSTLAFRKTPLRAGSRTKCKTLKLVCRYCATSSVYLESNTGQEHSCSYVTLCTNSQWITV